MFRKFKKLTGKGKSGIKSFDKHFDVANYVPVDYQDTIRWIGFCENAERNFTKIISGLSVDDLCYEVLDQLIDSEANKNKKAIERQHTNHIYTTLHDAGILKGNIESAEEHLAYLEEDLKQVCSEIEDLRRKLKEAE